jgi:hypothetical protein
MPTRAARPTATKLISMTATVANALKTKVFELLRVA